VDFWKTLKIRLNKASLTVSPGLGAGMQIMEAVSKIMDLPGLRISTLANFQQ
jgi:hypothetical protein